MVKRPTTKGSAFANQLRAALQQTDNPRLLALTTKDISVIIECFWQLVTTNLQNGKRVVFEGWISFFLNPVKRVCFKNNLINKKDRQVVYKKRVRMNITDQFRQSAEIDMTEAEYQIIKKKG